MSDFDQNSMTPLVVDLDGTLTRTDTLHECLVILAKQSPLALLQLPFVLLGGKAKFKEFIAARVNINPAQIPYREELIDYLKQEKCRGRQLILATAAHTSIAEKVAEHLQLFDRVLASDLNNNLKGVQKLQAIHRVVGEDFAYAGDSKADIPIWNAASSAILVDVTAPIAAEVRSVTRIEREFSAQRISLNVWLKALRVHQWS